MRGGELFWLIPLAVVMVGPLIALFSMWSKTRIRELQIRERIAMIEKGLVPPPEVDPAGFDRAMGREWRSRRRPGRHLRAGITLMGVGFGLMLLIGLTADSVRQGIGVGGFLVIMGVAFLINSLLDPQQDGQRPAPGEPPAGQTPPQG